MRPWTRALRVLAALTGERIVQGLNVQILDRLIADELRRVQEREQR